MSDTTNETTRTDERARFDQHIGVLTLEEVRRAIACACRECDHGLVHSLPSIRAVLKTAFAALTDLDRLAGPVCDYPPCKGARAVEHRLEQLGTICTFIDNPQDPVEEWGPECGVLERDHGNDDHDFQPSSELAPHPPSPRVEAWLRARSAK